MYPHIIPSIYQYIWMQYKELRNLLIQFSSIFKFLIGLTFESLNLSSFFNIILYSYSMNAQFIYKFYTLLIKWKKISIN